MTAVPGARAGGGRNGRDRCPYCPLAWRDPVGCQNSSGASELGFLASALILFHLVYLAVCRTFAWLALLAHSDAAGLELIVQPFGYREAARFWGISDPRLAVLVHSVVGGTPAYRRELVRQDAPAGLSDFDTWVTRTALNPQTPLFREARYLLAKETEIDDTRKARSLDPRRRSRAHWTPECSGHRHRQDRHPTA